MVLVLGSAGTMVQIHPPYSTHFFVRLYVDLLPLTRFMTWPVHNKSGHDLNSSYALGMSKTTPTPSPSPSPSLIPTESAIPLDSPAQVGHSAFEWWSLIFDFIAKVSWPLLIVLFLSMLLTRRVQQALSSGLGMLTKTFKSFKVGGVEFVMNDDQIQERLGKNKIKLLQAESEQPEPAREKQGMPEPEAEPQVDSESRLDDPRIIALQSYNRLESVIAEASTSLSGIDGFDSSLSGNKKYFGSRKPMNMIQYLRILSQAEVLFAPELDTVNSLRIIRNEIAHNVALVEMSHESAFSYEAQCDQLIDSITSRLKRIKQGQDDAAMENPGT